MINRLHDEIKLPDYCPQCRARLYCGLHLIGNLKMFITNIPHLAYPGLEYTTENYENGNERSLL
jgi:hypothetical protein